MDRLYLPLCSPLLHEMPDPSIGLRQRLRHVMWRVVAVVVVASLLGALVLSVHFRVWDKDGPGRILYRFHDHVFLQLKGTVHTRHFPNILAVWGVIAVVVALALASWLLDESFILPVHISFANRAIHLLVVRQAIPFVGVRGWSRCFALPRIEPHLVRTVAHREHQKALIELGRNELNQADGGLCRRVSRLTRFIVELEKHFPTNPIPHSKAVELWCHTYLLLCAYGAKRADRFRWDMEAAFDTLTSTQAGEKTEFIGREHFHPSKFVAELQEVRSCYERDRPDAELGNRLTDANDTRRQILDQIYDQLQTTLTNAALGRASRRTANDLPLDLSLQDAAISGRVAQDIALHLALIRDNPAIAQAYLDSCDSLFLLTEAFHVGLDASIYRNPEYQLYAHLSGNGSAPTTDPYPLLHATNVRRLVAQLGAQDLTRDEDAWRFELALREKSFMRGVDFQFERRQLGPLEQLAEPTELTRVTPSGPPKAGPRKKARPFWHKVPLWGRLVVGLWVLLAILGGILMLVGGGGDATPTPTSTSTPTSTPTPVTTPRVTVVPKATIPTPEGVNATPPAERLGDVETFWPANADSQEGAVPNGSFYR